MPRTPADDDPAALERFIAAQEGVHGRALAELRQGRKQSHWMWFVFPQLRGLGQSRTAWFYGIEDADEARRYLNHPLLGRRLIDCAEAVLTHGDRTAEAIFGPVDAVKLRSSATLFGAVARRPSPFGELIDRFFDGTPCRLTLERLDGTS